MHTVVFGWFGASAVWFLPLLWRLVKSALPGGAGLRGPGTIRLWLGFICVLVASCTLEASLVDVQGLDGFGHALAAGLTHLIGRVAAPMAMLGLLGLALPWLIGFRWPSFFAWANDAFGLGLSRRTRDDEPRGRPRAADAAPAHSSAPINTMAPKANGRYARPTVWRPPATTTRAGGAGAAGAAATAAAGVAGHAAGMPPGSSPGSLSSLNNSRNAARADSGQHAAGRQPGRPAPWTPAEPVAPSGWLSTDAPRAHPRESAPASMESARVTATPPAVFGSTAALQSSKAAAARGASANPAVSSARSAALRAASLAQGRQPVAANAASSAAQPARPVASPASPAVRRGTSNLRVPAYFRANSSSPQPVEPAASVQETLRSIEENAARWTELAGASLARRTAGDPAKAVEAWPPPESGNEAAGHATQANLTGFAGMAGGPVVAGAAAVAAVDQAVSALEAAIGSARAADTATVRRQPDAAGAIAPFQSPVEAVGPAATEVVTVPLARMDAMPASRNDAAHPTGSVSADTPRVSFADTQHEAERATGSGMAEVTPTDTTRHHSLPESGESASRSRQNMGSPAPVSPAPLSPAPVSPALVSPALVSPALDSPALDSPALVSPALGSPALDSPALVSPALASAALASAALVSNAMPAAASTTLYDEDTVPPAPATRDATSSVAPSKPADAQAQVATPESTLPVEGATPRVEAQAQPGSAQSVTATAETAAAAIPTPVVSDTTAHLQAQAQIGPAPAASDSKTVAANAGPHIRPIADDVATGSVEHGQADLAPLPQPTTLAVEATPTGDIMPPLQAVQPASATHAEDDVYEPAAQAQDVVAQQAATVATVTASEPRIELHIEPYIEPHIEPYIDTPVATPTHIAAEDASSAMEQPAHAPAVEIVPSSLAPWDAMTQSVALLRTATASGSSMQARPAPVSNAPIYVDTNAPLSIDDDATPAQPADAANEPAPPASSNIVRFPGAAAVPHAQPSAQHIVGGRAPDMQDQPQPESADAQAAQDAPPAPAPRAAVRGHSGPAFEFHAPSASHIELPSLDLLAPASSDVEPISEEKLAETGALIEQRLQEFKVPVTVVGASAGPVITRFEVEPALGVRGSQIVGLMKDLSRGLGLTSIRVVETIPGKTCMGLELPNAKRQTIRLSEILQADVYQHSKSNLTLAMGKDITGHPVVTDLAKAPHMLVAGTTGSGKSVAINAMIVSLLYKATPEDVRLIMIDPKMLELSVYEGIPHLLAPVVTDMKLAANALNWCVGEMEKRYRLMSAVGVRNLQGFNQKIRDAAAKEKKIGNPFSLTPDDPEPLSPLPLIVVVIDELADLMMVAGKKIEELIARLAQKARAAGIHLILATQRPSVDVITGLIKANIPTRVAFQVSSKIDSRTILDQMGAESLLGQGDMLFLPPGTGYPQRVHGAFVADEEVHRIVEHLKQFGEPEYVEGILDGPTTEGGGAQDLFGETPDAEADPLYDEAVAFVVRTRRASISAVQRQLRIGYNRAARLVEQMETAGLVSAMGINGSREVLAPGPAE